MNKYLTSFNYDNITFTYTEYCCKLIKASRKIWKKTIDYKNMVKKLNYPIYIVGFISSI